MARGKGTIKAGITITPGLKQIGDSFEGLGKEFVDYREMWKRLSPKIGDEANKIWSSQGGAIGAKWQPLTEAYKQRKINDPNLARSGGGRLMVRTGALKRGLKTFSKTKKAMRYGVKKIPYARSMQFQLGKARPYLAVTDKMQRAFLEEANDFIAKKLRTLDRKLGK